MRVTCERCLRRYDVPDATVKGRKIRARCKCGARVVVQDEERAAKSIAAGSQTTGSIQRPARWFVDITSWEPIAMDLRQLVRAFDAGRIDADTLVWRKGMPDWRRLRDVTELAERLINGDGAQKVLHTETPVEIVTSGSEPPPRQSERSRTPPASYTVSAKHASEQGGAPAHGNVRESNGNTGAIAASASDPGGTSPGLSLTGSARPSSSPSRGSAPRPPSVRKARGKTPSRPGQSPMSAQPRTITQTGMPVLGDAGGRLSAAPALPAARTNGSEDVEAPAAGRSSSPNLASPGTRPRETRNPTPPGGQRRGLSSDETPAQKPSSISVPPGAMTSGPARPRGRRLIAIAAVIMSAAFFVQRLVVHDTGASAEQGRTATELHADPRQVENALVPGAATRLDGQTEQLPSTAGNHDLGGSPPSKAGVGALPSSTPSPASDPTQVVAQAPTQAAVVTPRPRTQPTTLEPGAAQQHRPISDLPERARSSGVDGEAILDPATGRTARDNATASAGATGKHTTGNDTTGNDTNKSATDGASAPPAARPTNPAATAAPAAPPAADGQNQAPVAGAAPPAAAPAPPAAPRPFAAKIAEQQLDVAAWKASTCDQMGPTRGSGRVNVLIEPWGRVVRVTHLNQAFEGTPVGLCVVQAFQQLQVPPFDGDSKSLTGSFVIQ